MLYHVSRTGNLKVIEPKISTHNKAYVYALRNLHTALLFGAEKDDFDFILDEINGKPRIYECYPNAFKEIYSEKSCSIYELEETGFRQNMTDWKPELVSEQAVEVIKEIKVTNLYDILMEEVEKGNIILNLYEHSKEYKSMISNHILDRIVRFGILDGQIPEKLSIKFPKIINVLQKISNGEYLD